MSETIEATCSIYKNGWRCVGDMQGWALHQIAQASVTDIAWTCVLLAAAIFIVMGAFTLRYHARTQREALYESEDSTQ